MPPRSSKAALLKWSAADLERRVESRLIFAPRFGAAEAKIRDTFQAAEGIARLYDPAAPEPIAVDASTAGLLADRDSLKELARRIGRWLTSPQLGSVRAVSIEAELSRLWRLRADRGSLLVEELRPPGKPGPTPVFADHKEARAQYDAYRMAFTGILKGIADRHGRRGVTPLRIHRGAQAYPVLEGRLNLHRGALYLCDPLGARSVVPLGDAPELNKSRSWTPAELAVRLLAADAGVSVSRVKALLYRRHQLRS